MTNTPVKRPFPLGWVIFSFLMGISSAVGYSWVTRPVGNGVTRTDKFAAEVIAVWWSEGRNSADYFTLRFPNEEVKDIPVATGLRFAGKTGDAVFGTVYNGKYTVEGIRRKPWNDTEKTKSSENTKRVFDIIKKAL